MIVSVLFPKYTCKSSYVMYLKGNIFLYYAWGIKHFSSTEYGRRWIEGSRIAGGGWLWELTELLVKALLSNNVLIHCLSPCRTTHFHQWLLLISIGQTQPNNMGEPHWQEVAFCSEWILKQQKNNSGGLFIRNGLNIFPMI